MKIRYALVAVLLCLAVFVAYNPREVIEPEVKPLAEFPSSFGTWIMQNNTVFGDGTLRVLRATDYLMRTYVNNEGQRIGLYIGYHSGGPNSGPIHSPRNCLPGGGWEFLNDQQVVVKS